MPNTAKQAVAENLLSGYRHHAFTLEQDVSKYLLKGEGNTSWSDTLSLETYATVLAPQRLRAMKNALICHITLLSRSAIRLGVDAEVSFSLSDYYIYALEEATTELRLQELLIELTKQYRKEVHLEQHRTYSLPVTHAIRYIHQNLYSACRVVDIAQHIHLNAQYFAVIFKAEVGQEPSTYVRDKKISEAKALLRQCNCSVAEIADALGFCDTSHFVRVFKRTVGITPKQFASRSETEQT